MIAFYMSIISVACVSTGSHNCVCINTSVTVTMCSTRQHTRIYTNVYLSTRPFPCQLTPTADNATYTSSAIRQTIEYMIAKDFKEATSIKHLFQGRGNMVVLLSHLPLDKRY